MAVPTTRKYPPFFDLRSHTQPVGLTSLQLAAVPLLDPQHVLHERIALQKHFKMKRDHVLKRLKAIGLEVTLPPVATFYIWLNLEHLPAPINNGLTFFEELLKEKTIVYIFTRPYGNGLSMYSLVFFLTFIYTKRVISIIERLALRRLAHN